MLEIVSGQFLSATPYGAHYAVSGASRDPLRDLLFALMSEQRSPSLTEEAACRWCNSADPQAALDTLLRAQSLAMVQGAASPCDAPAGPLELTLPRLLPGLSERGQALLADAQGFYLALAGFRHETAEELAALSADVANLQTRHARLLGNNLGLGEASWGVVDAGGASRLGIWPLHVAGQRFALVIAGRPRLHQPDFAQLVWALRLRYGTRTDAAPVD